MENREGRHRGRPTPVGGPGLHAGEIRPASGRRHGLANCRSVQLNRFPPQDAERATSWVRLLAPRRAVRLPLIQIPDTHEVGVVGVFAESGRHVAARTSYQPTQPQAGHMTGSNPPISGRRTVRSVPQSWHATRTGIGKLSVSISTLSPSSLPRSTLPGYKPQSRCGQLREFRLSTTRRTLHNCPPFGPGCAFLRTPQRAGSCSRTCRAPHRAFSPRLIADSTVLA